MQRIPFMFTLILMILISFDVSPSEGQTINGDFSGGLYGWYTEGDVNVEDGVAILRTGGTGGPYITSLSTDFIVSGDRLTFRYYFDIAGPDGIKYPGFPSYGPDFLQMSLDAGKEGYYDVPLAWSPTGGFTPFSMDISTITPGARAVLRFMLFDEDDGYISMAAIDDVSDPANSVPEPGTLILIGGGLVGLFAYSRYKGSSKMNLCLFILLALPIFSDRIAHGELLEVNAENKITLEFTSPFFNTKANLLTLDMTVTNISDTSLFTPIKVVITGISAPDVIVANPDGYTSEGLPYFDITTYLEGKELSPGEATSPVKIAFYNPRRVKFRWDQDVIAYLNVSTEERPVIEGICLVAGEDPPVCEIYLEGFETEDLPFEGILQRPLPEKYLYEQVRVYAFDMEDLPLEVMINGERAAYNEGEFYYYRNLTLNDGLNPISILVTNNAGLSTGREISLYIDSVPPVISVTEPADGAVVTASDPVISGTVDDPEINTVILTKDFITREEVPVLDGTFSGNLLLSPGHNPIRIEVSDSAGNPAYYDLDVAYVYTELGTITGNISSGPLGLPIAGAMVAAVSDGDEEKVTVSGEDGVYSLEGIRSGDITLSIEKDGYTSRTLKIFSPGGETPFIQNVALMPLSNPGAFTLTGQVKDTGGAPLSEVKIAIKDTLLSGTSDLNGIYIITGIPRTSFIAEALHGQYEMESLNVNAGMYSDETTILTHNFILRNIPFAIGIISPGEGAHLYDDSVLVTGFIRSGGRDVGVRVNGVLAQVYNGYFMANDVPLAEGVNRITAEMLDPSGTLLIDSLDVALLQKEGMGVTIHAQEAGIVPSEISVEVEGPEGVSFTGYNLEISGPGVTEVISEGTSGGTIRYRVFVHEAGIYTLSFHAVDSDGNTYRDTFGFTGMARGDVGEALRMLWMRFKEDLTANHVADALSLISPETRWRYSEQFSLLGDRSPDAFAEIGDIGVISLRDNVAKARVSVGEMTHYVWFVRDIYGLWKIHKF